MEPHSTEDIATTSHTPHMQSPIRHIIHTLSPFERLVFLVLVTIFMVSTLVVLSNLNKQYLVEIPSFGGSFAEGVVGSPRFINPILAQSNADRDLGALIYAGLMKTTPQGTLIHELAKSHTVSLDGLAYTVFLRDDIQFHDGQKVTADDVIFTVELVQNPTLKSPKRGSWEGVLVEKISDTEIVFTLEQPYSPFMQNLTLGILPKHIWKEKTSEEILVSVFNTRPIGAGPFMLKSIKKSNLDISLYYELESFPQYALGSPYIKEIFIYFYPNEDFLIDAYINGKIDAVNSVSASNLAYADLNKDTMSIERITLPRIFGVFFNQNQASVFAHIEIRKALSVALDRDKIIDEIFSGYGTAITSPIPPNIIPPLSLGTSTVEENKTSLSRRKEAIDILERNGWSVSDETGMWEKKTKIGRETLSFSISTSNIPELKAVATMVKEDWEAIGARVDLKIFEIGDLNQNVIRPRKYDALLFGEIVGRELDLYAFWHSSQRNDPGLNIALYANITADALLEDARVIDDRVERIKKYIAFEEEIKNDIPAVFIYAPDFIYVAPENVSNIKLGSISTPSERFLNVHEWNINTDNVWKFLIKN